MYTLTFIQENMVPIFDPGNFLLVLMLCTVIGIPLSVLTVAIFYVVRWIPSRLAQCLIPLVAGIVFAVAYTSMGIPALGDSGLFQFFTGMFIHPLLILPPIIIMQKYLKRIPVMYAVSLTAFISMVFIITLGAMLGDVRLEESRNIAWESIVPVIKDLIIASILSGLILGLDRILSNPEKKNP